MFEEDPPGTSGVNAGLSSGDIDPSVPGPSNSGSMPEMHFDVEGESDHSDGGAGVDADENDGDIGDEEFNFQGISDEDTDLGHVTANGDSDAYQKLTSWLIERYVFVLFLIEISKPFLVSINSWQNSGELLKLEGVTLI